MTSDGHSLHLYEQLMLLALRDDKGTLESKASMYQYALGGAILTELAINEVIRIRSDKKTLVDPVSSQGIGDPILDECLELVSSARRRRRARDWVARFGRLKKLRHRVAEGLCRKGILAEAEASGCSSSLARPTRRSIRFPSARSSSVFARRSSAIPRRWSPARRSSPRSPRRPGYSPFTSRGRI